MKLPEIPSAPAPGEDLQKHYVSRLERLIRLRREFEEHLNDLGVDLLERSIRATFRDCVETGAEARARALMTALQ